MLHLRRLAILCAFVCLGRADAEAQLQQGTIQGTVLGRDGSLVDGAIVTLLDGLGDPLVSITAEGGRFRLTNVAPGTYSLRADAPPL
jgi:protocatechuate 3,4-dioxygenase beta subunit